ncbi:hypothetical protein HMN09_01362500 [Mycena chlorophos]|uniref:Uncharacterized protein n=1 Tax=Mycena chlorophos TaxID=658473 RepID=A0A8H6RYX7_MYCCL|nr:hypothetical protein HMN09_01362500 [Mycena chlorophos]
MLLAHNKLLLFWNKEALYDARACILSPTLLLSCPAMGQAISTLTSRLASKILEYAAAERISHHTVHSRIGSTNLAVEKLSVKMEDQEQLQNPLHENMDSIPSTPKKNSSKVYTFNIHGGTGGSGGKGGQEGGAGGVGQGPRIIINACGDRILTTAPSSPG